MVEDPRGSREYAALFTLRPVSDKAATLLRGRKSDSGCEGALGSLERIVSADVIRKTATWPWVSGSRQQAPEFAPLNGCRGLVAGSLYPQTCPSTQARIDPAAPALGRVAPNLFRPLSFGFVSGTLS